MEKEKKENAITDNNVDKRVLVVGKLKGTKQPKKVSSKKTNKTKTSKTPTKAPAKTIKANKTSTTKINTAKSAKSTSKKTGKTTNPVTKASAKKETKKTVKPKTTNVTKNTTKKPESQTTKKAPAKKVATKKKNTKTKMVEKIKKMVKSTAKNITKKKENNKSEATKKIDVKPKTNKIKKETESISVLRVDIKSEEFKTIVKNVVIFILVVALAISLIYIGDVGKQNVSNKMLYSSLSKDIKIEELTNGQKKPTEAIKILKQENPEIQGWIKIEGTNVNYPLLQGKDNEYYLTHNFKNEKTKYGSIFVNSNCDISNDKSNIIIYGHDMKDGQMFSDLIKYTDKEYYNEHKTIKVTTENSENEYTIVSTFKSKVFYKDEKNVFRFYQYYNLENEKQFKDYISNCKKLQLYDTGVEANYGDQLVTLITCEYSNENGRIVVVAKRN